MQYRFDRNRVYWGTNELAHCFDAVRSSRLRQSFDVCAAQR